MPAGGGGGGGGNTAPARHPKGGWVVTGPKPKGLYRPIDSRNVTHPNSATVGQDLALKKYTNSSGDFNRYLRKGTVSGNDAAIKADIQNHIAHIDDAFAGATAVKEPFTVFRNVNSANKLFGPVGSKVGQTFSDRAYVSTAIGKQSTFNFGNTNLKIDVPKGSVALDLRNISSIGDDSEVLLPRGSSFRINSDQMVDGIRRIHATLMPHPDFIGYE